MIENNGDYQIDKDLFCDNCGRQITVDNKEVTDECLNGCSHCVAPCAICGYKHFKDDMYERIVKDGCNWNRGLVCFDCANDEGLADELKMPVVNVFEAIASCTKPLTTKERIELGIL